MIEHPCLPIHRLDRVGRVGQIRFWRKLLSGGGHGAISKERCGLRGTSAVDVHARVVRTGWGGGLTETASRVLQPPARVPVTRHKVRADGAATL